MNTPRFFFPVAIATLLCSSFATSAFAQAEAQPSGSLRGIRIDGELMPFTTGLRAVNVGAPVLGRSSDEKLYGAAGSRGGGPTFTRDGNRQIITGGLANSVSQDDVVKINNVLRQLLSTDKSAKAVLDKYPNFPLIAGGPQPGQGQSTVNSGLTGRIVYEDTGPGIVSVDVQVTASTNADLAGVYYYIHLPAAEYSGAGSAFFDPVTIRPDNQYSNWELAKGVEIENAHHHVEVNFTSPTKISVVSSGRGPNTGVTVYFPVSDGPLTAAEPGHLAFTIKVSGDVDKSPATLTLDPSKPGPTFDGMGGDFRLQSPADPAEVEYNLKNMRVAWSRVNLPLNVWQPDENTDPLQAAASDQLNNQVRQAMQMEAELALKDIPIVLTVWDAPNWALSDYTNRPEGGGGGQARHINPAKWDAICRSIGEYLDYIKQNYQVEPRYFSFNETDIGYDILQTPEEHAEAIKRLGAYFAARGYKTKMILGDTGDPTGINFINAALADPEAVKYIGAVSYHSWRGGTDDQFIRWGQAAKKLGVPLLIGEGGMDSDAYRYQSLLLEPWYALQEISEYVDICRLSQPASILQWQLTENYSLLTHGSGGVLGPAQRFWQIRQLGLTPAGSAALPITCDKPNLSYCAFTDPKTSAFTIHVANSGATRPATVSGLPLNVKELHVFVTDAQRGIQDLGPVAVTNGRAQVTLGSMSLTTLTNVPNFNGGG